MSTSTVNRMARAVGIVGVGAVIAGSLALSGGATHPVSVHTHRAATAAAEAGPRTHTHQASKLAKKVTKSHLRDSPSAAKARGEVRASSPGEAGISPSTPIALAPHAPKRGVRNTSYNPNWAGIAVPAKAGTFQGVAGDWYVPAIRATADNRFASTWIGIDGDGNQQLLQTGAEEDSINGKPFYGAWWEILPASETPITLNGSRAPVAPGDFMYSYIYETSAGVYRVFLDDVTQKWYYDQAHYYNGSGASAEWIQEASTMANQVSKPLNFGGVGFGWMYVDEGNAWYRTNYGAASRMDIAQGTTRYTSTSIPTQTAPQTFTVTYTGG